MTSDHPVKRRKKLIEVAIPLEAINAEGSRRKRKAPRGYPTSFHKWWAQRPVAAARAVLFAQLVDDPSSCPELFPTKEDQDSERKRLFRIIERLVDWENSCNESVLREVRNEISKSWERACSDNSQIPEASSLFSRHSPPTFWDPFGGSGAIPMEAQRLGLDSISTDLNPVAVLINKATIEIPSLFSGCCPAHPRDTSLTFECKSAVGASGLAEDVRYYSNLVKQVAFEKVKSLYPLISIEGDAHAPAKSSKSCRGSHEVVAWLWARTVRSPDPAFSHVEVPLASTFLISNKPGKEIYIHPIISADSYQFTVRYGTPDNLSEVKCGTKNGRAAFKCLLSGAAISNSYLREEGEAGRIGMKLMAIVAKGPSGRVYLPPTDEMESIANAANPLWVPDLKINHNPRDIRTQLYGLTRYQDIFTRRQIAALNAFSEAIREVVNIAEQDALKAGYCEDKTPLDSGGRGH